MVNGSSLGLVCGLWFVVWFMICRWVWSQFLSLVHGLLQTWWLLVVDGFGCLGLLWLVGAILGVWQWLAVVFGCSLLLLGGGCGGC